MAMFGNSQWKFGFGQPMFGDADPSPAPGVALSAAPTATPAPQSQSAPSWLPQIPALPADPTGFNKPGGLAEKLGAIGGILQSYGGQQNNAYQDFLQRQEQRKQLILAQRQQAMKAFLPQEVGGNLVRLNPQTGQYETLYTPPAKPKGPHYWETNDGSLGVVDPATGKPTILYKDPTPKIDWITADDGKGGKSLIPYIRGTGASNTGLDATPTVEDGYRYTPGLGGRGNQANWAPVAGGPTPPASGAFR